MGTFGHEIGGKEGCLQCAQVLAPYYRLSHNPNICDLRLCLRVRYGDKIVTVSNPDKELPLEETIFLCHLGLLQPESLIRYTAHALPMLPGTAASNRAEVQGPRTTGHYPES